MQHFAACGGHREIADMNGDRFLERIFLRLAGTDQRDEIIGDAFPHCHIIQPFTRLDEAQENAKFIGTISAQAAMAIGARIIGKERLVGRIVQKNGFAIGHVDLQLAERSRRAGLLNDRKGLTRPRPDITACPCRRAMLGPAHQTG